MARTARAGFTLIELLVVIAIIGLLASIIMVSLISTQARARDARRVSDMNQLQKALALYESGHNRYPVETPATVLSDSSVAGAALLAESAMPAIPRDPSPSYSYTYVSDAAGNTYTISFCLETDTIRDYAQGCGNAVSP